MTSGSTQAASETTRASKGQRRDTRPAYPHSSESFSRTFGLAQDWHYEKVARQAPLAIRPSQPVLLSKRTRGVEPATFGLGSRALSLAFPSVGHLPLQQGALTAGTV